MGYGQKLKYRRNDGVEIKFFGEIKMSTTIFFLITKWLWNTQLSFYHIQVV